jgi:hypothetical protein
MHARELVDVAGLVALNGPLLVRGSVSPGSVHLEQYWSTSKCRAESWNRMLKAYATLAGGTSGEDFDKWIQIRAALDEIFTSEMLTRVWSAVLVACDRVAGITMAEPVARSVMATHMEARHRALALLLHGNGLSTKQAVALNRLRRRAERWADVLVGGLLHLCDVREFAVEPERAEDFATDLADQRGNCGGQNAWRLTLVSLRNAFQTGLAPQAANPEANARISASILGCFPAELFDSTGVFQSLWMMRLTATASDAQGMITELLQSSLPFDPKSDSKPRPKRRI